MSTLNITLLFVSGSFFTQLCLFENYATPEFLRVSIVQFIVLAEQLLYYFLGVYPRDELIVIASVFWAISQISITYLYFNRIRTFTNIGKSYIYLNVMLFAFAIMFNIGDTASWMTYALSRYTITVARYTLVAFDILAASMITLMEALSFRILATTYKRTENVTIFTTRCLHLAVVTTSIAISLHNM
ncbi:hypothetical protein HK102_009691, partial [Quaeritorhiza haematococci]